MNEFWAERFVAVMDRIAEATERQAELLARQLDALDASRADRKAEQPTESDRALEARHIDVLEMHAEQLKRTNELAVEQMKRRVEWERVEREHMAVCERKYQERQNGEGGGDVPTKH